MLLLAVFPFLFQNKLDLQYFRKKDLCSSMCLLSLNDDHYLIFIPELYQDIFTAFEMFVTLSYSYTQYSEFHIILKVLQQVEPLFGCLT